MTGRVQGVWFRESTRQRASELGLDGWVQNRPDGSVEVLFEGDPAAVEQALAFVAEGPSAARVDAVRAGPTDALGETVDETQRGFHIRR